MAFTLSGTVITQLGTDVDLSGLSGIAGVTTSTIISASHTVTTYVIASNLQLQVNGTLTLTPKIEKLVIDGATMSGGRLRINNTFIIDDSVQRFTDITYGTNEAIVFTKEGGRPWNRDALLGIYGTFEQYGGTITGAFSVFWNASLVSFLLRDAKWGSISSTNSTNIFYCIANLNNFDVLGWTIVFAKFEFAGNNFNSINFGGVKYQSSSAGFSTGNSAPSGAFWELLNFAGTDMSQDFSFFQSKYVRFVNSVPITWGINGSGFGPGGAGLGEETHAIRLFPEFNGAVVSDVSVYFADSDNGSRANRDSQNYVDDRVYSGVTSSTGLELDVLLKVQQATSGVLAPEDMRFVDRTININSISYNHAITLAQYVGTLGTSESHYPVSYLLSLDASITEPVRAIAAAYTQQDTASKAYDHLKAFLVTNYEGEAETIVIRVGDLLDCRGYDVVIDGTGSGPATFDGTTVTLNASTFTGGVTTTGAVSLLNGATVSGTIIDSTANSALVFVGIDSWAVYPTEADRDANTNVLGSAATGNYRFNYVASTEYWLRLTVSGETTLKAFAPASAGESPVSLQTAALLMGIGATTSEINTKLDYAKPVIYYDPLAVAGGDGGYTHAINDMDTAIAAARALGTSEIDLLGNAVFSTAANSLDFVGNKQTLFLGFGGQDIDGSLFDKLIVYGNCTTVNGGQIKNCIVGFAGFGGVNGFTGIIRDSILKETLTTTGDVSIINAGTEHGEVLTVSVGADLSVTQFTGKLLITDVVGGVVDVHMHSGDVEIAASCTGGAITISGMASVTDQSNGSAVNDMTETLAIKAARDHARAANVQTKIEAV